MKHSARFEKLCEEARSSVREVSIVDLKSLIDRENAPVLLDVREDHEWSKGHIPGAQHLGRGIIERDIESKIPELGTEIVLYCGGGYRSALAAVSLQKMGYTNVSSMAGGIRAWRDAKYPVE